VEGKFAVVSLEGLVKVVGIGLAGWIVVGAIVL